MVFDLGVSVPVSAPRERVAGSDDATALDEAQRRRHYVGALLLSDP